MTDIALSLGDMKTATLEGFQSFYANIFKTQGYFSTMLFQTTHLHMLLVHLLETDKQPTHISLGELLDFVQEKNMLTPKQIKECRTLQELSLFYTSKSLLSLSTSTPKGTYFYGKMSEILFQLTQML